MSSLPARVSPPSPERHEGRARSGLTLNKVPEITALFWVIKG